MKKRLLSLFFIFINVNTKSILRRTVVLSFIGILSATQGYAQAFNKTLVKADKFYIQKAYANAVKYYEEYLVKNPKDFYASRQAAISYDKMNKPDMAIDYWPAVIESVDATEQDNLEYAKCLLANYRIKDAARVFVQLSKSSNTTIAEWGKAYVNTAHFFKDSALCKVTEVIGINTGAHEYAPSIHGGKLLYISDPLKNIRMFSSITGEPLFTISTASKKDSLTFDPAGSFVQPKAKNANGLFCFSADENTLYFSMAVSSKDLGLKKGDLFYKFQLYTTSAAGSGSLQPFRYNSTEYDVLHPCLSKDGNRLFFSSNMKGTLGGKDLFVCDLVNGEWSAPVNLGPGINTTGDEVFPYLTEEGVLYFSSNTRPGLGGLDLFEARPSTTGKLFERAQNVGSPLNSQFDDFGLLILPGGKTGYLSSNRKNNTDDDIFYFRNGKP